MCAILNGALKHKGLLIKVHKTLKTFNKSPQNIKDF